MLKRTQEIKIRFTEAELADINEKAKTAGLSREAYCRYVLRGATVKQAPSPDIPILIRDIRRVGSNVDQLLKIANATHLLDAPQMRKVLAHTYLAVDAVVKAYTMEE